MATKKYLTLEEAARHLGMAPDELVRQRERGEIRGFADRGTWKFKSEDVEEYARTRQPDSSPEVPILDDSSADHTPLGVESTSVLAPDSGIRKSGSGRMSKMSDSDVRLLLDDTLVPGGKDSDPEVTLTPLGSSDSDVRLMDDAGGVVDSGSDSDVKLISTSSDADVAMTALSGSSADSSSDSDVKLIAPTSDSDVRLAPPSSVDQGPSDSDVRLVGTDDLATLGSESDIRLTTDEGSSMDITTSSIDSGTGIKLGSTSPSEESSVLIGGGEDSGIALDTGSSMKVGGGSSSDSGITLQSLADSGISLEKVDSGISLAGPLDSGIALDADSGIALDKEADSGIALQSDSGIALSADSGIRLADSAVAKDKGKKAPGKKDLGKKEPGKKESGKKDDKKDKDVHRTAPMLSLSDDDNEDSTQVEMAAIQDEEDSAYKLSESDSGQQETNVVLFSDDEEEAPAAPVAKKGKGRAPEDSFALEESGVEFAEAEDFSDDEDLEVAEDVLGDEAEDLDEIDVFEPAEEDFGDSSIQSGESHAELAAPVSLRAAAPVEAPWDGFTFAGLALSGVALLLTGAVMFDLVRTMWYWDQNVVVSGALLDMVRGMF